VPLTAKGREIMAAMKEQYGEEKGEQVFYASKAAGKITGVDTTGDADPTLAAINRYHDLVLPRRRAP
jgi:hypothetical protein